MSDTGAKYTSDTFKVLLKKLVQSPSDFTPDDCAECFRHLCVQGASEAQVSRLERLLHVVMLKRSRQELF